MAKPTDSACNLNCDYCFFLKKERPYPRSDFGMSDEGHEAYIRQLFEAHRRYTWAINFREGWRGHLWQGRFSSYAMANEKG
jgi:sulfatase maturation enzyme AslB (radical SAM superfamily)